TARMRFYNLRRVAARIRHNANGLPRRARSISGVQSQSLWSLLRKHREPGAKRTPFIQCQVSNFPRRSWLRLVNRVGLQWISRKLARRKDLLNLARIRLNDDKIGDSSLLASYERQAHQQMPVNGVTVKLARHLGLVELTDAPPFERFVLAALQF